MSSTAWVFKKKYISFRLLLKVLRVGLGSVTVPTIGTIIALGTHPNPTSMSQWQLLPTSHQLLPEYGLPIRHHPTPDIQFVLPHRSSILSPIKSLRWHQEPQSYHRERDDRHLHLHHRGWCMCVLPQNDNPIIQATRKSNSSGSNERLPLHVRYEL